jgi:hypothetical protein
MSGSPTLQSLALYARDHFGDNGYPFEGSIPSSLDVVVAACADEPNSPRVAARAGALLCRRLQSHGRSVTQADIEEFVRRTMS